MTAMLTGCGGGGGGSSSTAGNGATGNAPTTSTPAPTPTPTATAAGCSLRERQDWITAQMREWYLFYDTLPANPDPSPFTSVDSYLDSLTSTARSQGKDRHFTYLTSIKEEDAYYSSGSTAGFGWRFGLTADGHLYVTEAFEGAPGLAAGVDRGAEIVAIGTSASNLQTVASLFQSDTTGAALNTALGPDSAGTTRYFQVKDGSGTRTVAVAKSDFTLDPVSSRYGAQIITDGGQRYGYVNLRTFITTADTALRTAFARFKSAGVTNIIVDLRYNGGGLLSTAELLTNLLGANRSTGDVMSYTSFRPEKASNNETTYFAPQAQSVAATRIAFIGTGGTASASEYVINAYLPYLHANAALIGTNTYGKPVGQIPLDKTACDDRLRVIAFALQNSARQGAYYGGLAAASNGVPSSLEASCRASDDIAYPMGDPREASTRSALDFLQGKSCTKLTASASAEARALSVPIEREALMPASGRISTARREVPGLF
ncbi:S41 family peptidase [Sphingomonas sp. CD22]|uniref:S41 family peptidase n=1 Tax=Sphingomonas sp. CD22 TaxID=3100214 RepID=UPI002ADFA088|nr:S41 family peptidase [Sphingomonas sp. CD22]MEA1083406.1 S41 family peptidase [Sphingomonas sp. CD22]